MKTNSRTYRFSRKSLMIMALLASVMLSSHIFAGDIKVLQEKTFPTQPGKNLYLSTSVGDVSITTWDRPEIYVKISGNRNAEKKMSFHFEPKNEGLSIYGKRDSWLQWLFWSSLNLKYEIKIPSNFNAHINTSGGDIKVAGIKGSTKLETSGGDVVLMNSAGRSILSTSGGDIKVDGQSGDIKASTSGGDIIVRNTSGNLYVSTSGGDIVLDNKSGEVHANTSGGDISLSYRDANYGIYLGTTGGDILVKVPPEFSASADLHTTGGDVSCDLPVTRNGKWTSSAIKGDLNAGGKPLNCTTSGGDIKVVKQ